MHEKFSDLTLSLKNDNHDDNNGYVCPKKKLL